MALRVALVGYGRMGRQVEALAPRFGVDVRDRLTSADNADGSGVTRERLAGIDVVIDFSVPDAVARNVEAYCETGVAAVVGVTGWDAERERLLTLAEEAGIGLVHGSNFSIGANAFFGVVAEATRVMTACEELYDLAAFETHHRRKLDVPSGTALRLAETVRAAGWPREVQIASARLGHVPGTHELTWDSEVDTITCRHTARSRAGFAEGAVRAALWIRGRGGVYDFKERWREIAAHRTDPISPFTNHRATD